MVGSFVSSGLITQVEADQILALAEDYQSRAQQIGYSNEIPATWIETIRTEAP
jgi:hypothetical protein